MVLAGCIMVWAAERLMAPQIMASQKWRRRSGAGDLAAPPLPTRGSVVDVDDDVVGRLWNRDDFPTRDRVGVSR